MSNINNDVIWDRVIDKLLCDESSINPFDIMSWGLEDAFAYIREDKTFTEINELRMKVNKIIVRENKMPRICNGSLEAKPIVNDQKGYCECCNTHTDLTTEQVLKDLDVIENALKKSNKIKINENHKS